MKTKFLFGALAAFGMMTACSSDETADLEKQKGEGEGAESFVSFSVVSSNASGTRADSTDAEFAEAEGNEATINNVVLFFYDNAGNAINVNMGNTNTNYKIITAEDISLSGAAEPVGPEGGSTTNNVEHWFKKTVSLTTASTLTEARVLALVNANIKSDQVLDKNGEPISGSISKSSFFGSAFPGHYTKENGSVNDFVMSTSVYADATDNSKVISDVAIKIFDNEADAENNSAQIYVERVKARAQVIASTDPDVISDTQLYALTIDDDVKLPAEEKDAQLKIKVLGWDLNTTAKNAYMFKQLTPPYGELLFAWNAPTLHRSYWEAPYNHTGASDFNASFTPINIASEPNSGFKYCNPNTTTVNTKVLVYTQLIDAKDNKPADIASWYGNSYTLAGLKTAILEASPKVLFVAGTEEGQYVNIDEKYVDFRQGTGTTTTDMDKSWMAYPILKTKFKETDTDEITYYKKVETPIVGGGISISFVKIDTVAEAMQMIGFQNADGTNKLQGAKIWNEGRAYYFVDVEHLGEKKAMVRNHSYTIRIDGFHNLGTPIFKPDQIIPEPTLPEGDKSSYVSVTMNVLSWRIVPTQGVIFGK